MRTFLTLSIITLASCATDGQPNLHRSSAEGDHGKSHIPNERFSVETDGIKPMLWKDFNLIDENLNTCYSNMPIDPETCSHLIKPKGDAIYAAFRFAMTLNKLAKPNEPTFCFDFAQELLEDKERPYAIALATLDVSDRTRKGSNVYGLELPNIYLAKIIHDSFLESHPCTP